MLDKELLQATVNEYEIGTLISTPIPCAGGRTHHTYHLYTTLGQYVLKLFEWAPNRINSYRNAEKIADFFANKINAIPAIKNKRNDVITIMNQVLACIYPFVEGKIVSLGEIQHYHAKTIAYALAQMHCYQPVAIHAAAIEIPDLLLLTQHALAVKRLSFFKHHKMLQTVLNKFLALLTQLQNHFEEDKECLLQNSVVSHRDCDHYNVLWNKRRVFYLIDWERAGLINRTKDILVTSIYWSLSKEYIVQENLTYAFLTSYQRDGLTIVKDEIQSAFHGFIHDWLGWFDFNLVRILESDDKNAKDNTTCLLAIEEIKKTSNALPILLEQRKKIISCFV